jgi:hypothetical protein
MTCLVPIGWDASLILLQSTPVEVLDIYMYMSSYGYMCVLILLCMCPHTVVYVSSGCWDTGALADANRGDRVCVELLCAAHLASKLAMSGC